MSILLELVNISPFSIFHLKNMPIYIAIDISIKNIFNTDALKRYMWFLLCHYPIYIYLVYTHSVILVISNLIGSLSRTIQQYSPSREWIMCELSVFPIFLDNDLLKVDRILGLTFFEARKDLEEFNTAFFNLLWLSFVLDGLFTTPVYSRRRSRFVNSAFSNQKILAQKSKFIYDKQI